MSEEPIEEPAAQRPKEKSLAGPILLLIVILADVGLAIWGWDFYQEKRRRQRDYAAVNVAQAPKADPTNLAPRQRGAGSAAAVGGLNYLIKEEGGEPPIAAPAVDTKVTPEERERIKGAMAAYYRIKGDPRFSDSPAFRAWTRDFLTYPDLRAIHDRFQKDRNPIRFLADMTESPHFLRMRKKYLNAPDLQAFVGLMGEAPEVTGEADTVIRKANLAPALRDLAAFDEAAAKAAGPSRGPSEMSRLRQHPKFGKWIDDSGAPEISEQAPE